MAIKSKYMHKRINLQVCVFVQIYEQNTVVWCNYSCNLELVLTVRFSYSCMYSYVFENMYLKK